MFQYSSGTCAGPNGFFHDRSLVIFVFEPRTVKLFYGRDVGARPIEAGVSFEICTHVCHKVTRVEWGVRMPLCRTTARAAPFLFPTGVLTPRQTCYLGADFICARHIGWSRLSPIENRLLYFRGTSVYDRSCEPLKCYILWRSI